MRIMKLFWFLHENMKTEPAIEQAFFMPKFKESSHELELSLLSFSKCDIG